MNFKSEESFESEWDLVDSESVWNVLIIYWLFLGKTVSWKYSSIRYSGLVFSVPLNRFSFFCFLLSLVYSSLTFCSFDTLMNGLERGWEKGAWYDFCFQLLSQKATSLSLKHSKFTYHVSGRNFLNSECVTRLVIIDWVLVLCLLYMEYIC